MSYQINIVDKASAYAKENGVPVETIIKEMLHYDILAALSKSGLSHSVVFQGGTALRLCYGGSRYSEDLDFVTETGIDDEKINSFKEILKKSVIENYGLDVEIKNPKDKVGDKNIKVKKWEAKIYIEKQKHAINLEVASIPSFDNDLLVMQNHYQTGHGDIYVWVESLEEILADKIVAFGGREYFKARDIWDIKWLSDKGVNLNNSYINKKIELYGINNFAQRCQDRLDFMTTEMAKQQFRQEMSRFLNHNTYELMEKMPKFIDSIFKASNKVVNSYIDNKPLTQEERGILNSLAAQADTHKDLSL